MAQLLVIRGKAQQVFKAWDLLYSKLGKEITLAQLQQEYEKGRKD